MSKGEAELSKAVEVVREYMVRQNRPYSSTDVLNNLHKQFGKTSIIKALDLLVEQNVLKEKLISKQKIYWANQDQISCDDGYLQQLSTDIAKQSTKLQEITSSIKTLETDLKALNCVITVPELKALTSKLADKRDEKQKRLTECESGTKKSVPVEERNEVADRRKLCLEQWKIRKRKTTDILDLILDSCNKKKKDLFEDIGIETDEEHKAVMPEL